jgi:hypothetical protein
MTEPPDVYADAFQINLNPFGCTLNFLLSGPTPPAPGTVMQGERVASVRMSLEHLKAMTFLLHRQFAGYEQQAHVSIPLPTDVLHGMQIREEDWQAFWHG